MVKNTGIAIDEDVLDDFDDAIWERKMAGDIDRNTSRSEVIQQLMEDFIEETEEGNSKRQTAPTNS